jgi:tetratricopeptide (TPR) repeat protein
MVSNFVSAKFGATGRGKMSRLLSGVALSVALATGSLAATALVAPPAQAQEYTEAFVNAYNPIQTITNSGVADFSAARPLVPALVAALTNADERSAAGNLLLVVGQNLRDPALQRQGIELMLASGKVAPESQGQYYYYVGNFALQLRDYAGGRTALRQALAAGYAPTAAANDPALDPRTQILQSLFLEENFPELISTAGEFVTAAGAATQVPELWLSYGLQGAIETENAEAALRFSEPLVRYYPTARNIRNAVRVVTSLGNVDNGPVLADAQRLLFAADALGDRRDFVAYIASIDSRLMANETLRVLERGVSSGLLPQGDDYYAAEFAVASERAPSERRDAPGMLADARSSATGLEAYEAGELYLSLGDYAQAETLYAMALEKGSTDRNRDLTRLGIAQFQQGKTAEAQATFAQVQGDRAAVAALWSAFVASRG